MRVTVTTPFVDREALAKKPDDPDAAHLPIGKGMTVTADRGAELIGHGLVEAVKVEAKPADPAETDPPSTNA